MVLRSMLYAFYGRLPVRADYIYFRCIECSYYRKAQAKRASERVALFKTLFSL